MADHLPWLVFSFFEMKVQDEEPVDLKGKRGMVVTFIQVQGRGERWHSSFGHLIKLFWKL